MNKNENRLRRAKSTRSRIRQLAVARLSVHRTGQHIYAQVFDAADALDRMEAFASFHGPDFYGLPRNTGSVTLERRSWQVPQDYPFGDAVLKPLQGGELLAWKLLAR